MLAYSIPGFIRIISLTTFQPLYQVRTGKRMGYKVKYLSKKWIIGQKGNSTKYWVWLTEFGTKHKKIKADFAIFCGKTYIKTYKNALEIRKILSDEPLWKISDTNYRYISSDSNFLASFKGNEIAIIDIERQTYLKYSHFNECWKKDGRQNLFKFGFFGLKNRVKLLKSSNFSDVIEKREDNLNVFSMFYTENIIVIFGTGLMKVIDIETVNVIKAQKIPNSPDADSRIAVSDDIGIFVMNNHIEIWNLRIQKQINKIQFFDHCSNIQISLEKNQFSLISWPKRSFVIYSIESGEIIHTVELGNDYGYWSCYKFTGKHLIFYKTKSIGIWHKVSENCEYIHTGFEIQKIEGSSCGRWAAFHNNVKKNEAIIFNIETKSYKLVKHESCELNKDFACFSPCGNYLATASIFEIILWESATGIKVAKTAGLFPQIQNFSLSKCGKYIASYAKGDLILIWNLEEALKMFENGIAIDITLSLDRAMLSNATVFSENNLIGATYIDEESI